VEESSYAGLAARIGDVFSSACLGGGEVHSLFRSSTGGNSLCWIEGVDFGSPRGTQVVASC